MNDKNIEEKAKEFFLKEVSQGRIFTSMPDKYSISIDRDGFVFVNAEWNGGVKDYTGLGNIYKILYTDQQATLAQYKDALEAAKTALNIISKSDPISIGLDEVSDMANSGLTAIDDILNN